MMYEKFHPACTTFLEEDMLYGLSIVYALCGNEPNVDRPTLVHKWTVLVKRYKGPLHSLVTAHIPW